MSEPLLSPTAATYVKSYGGADSPRTSTAKAPPFVASPQDASPRFRVYKRRWLMLALFASHALCNNLVCYTFAPVADLAIEYYSHATAFPLDLLITIFFITYVLLAFPASRFVEQHGLRSGVLLGAWLQAAGATIRAMDLLGNTVHSSPTDMVLLGQVVASFGQSFFVIPPPLLASTWFAEDERTLATTIACNADALGIALAYMVCPWICTQVNHVPYLLQIVAIVSFGMALISTLLFENQPPQPPSYSALLRTLDQERSTTVTRILTHQIEHQRSIKRQITLSRYEINDAHFVTETANAATAAAGDGGDASAAVFEPVAIAPPSSSSAINSQQNSPASSPRGSRRPSLGGGGAGSATDDGDDRADDESMSGGGAFAYSSLANVDENSTFSAGSSEGSPLAASTLMASQPPPPQPLSPSASTVSRSSGGAPSSAAAPTATVAATSATAAASAVLYMPSLVVEPLPRQRGAPSSAPFGTMQSPSTPVMNSSPNARGRHHSAAAAVAATATASTIASSTSAGERARSRRGSDDDHEHEHDEHHEHDLDEDAHAELMAEHNREQPTWQLLRELGFVHVAISFAIGEATLNGFSTFMNSMLVPGGFSVFYVSWMGTFFVVSALVGSQIASTLVDKYKWYNAMMLVSFVGSVVSLVFFQQLSALPAPSEHTFLVTVAVLMVGFFVGPLQPISIEIAAECTYPAPEAASTAVQQVAGNLLSAGLIPLMLLLKDPVTQSMQKANWVMASTMLAAGLFYLNFSGSYRRLQAERANEERRHRPRIEISTA